jgi:hypothetical protein
MKKKRKSWPAFNHYAALASILGAGFSTFAYYRFNRDAQAIAILATAILYVAWGIIHHKLIHYLTQEIIFEYILVAAIGSLVLLSMIGF